MPSRTLLLEAGTDGGKKKPIGTRNRPVTGECITTGQGLGASWFELWLSCCSADPEVTKIQTDPSPSNLRAIRATKAGVLRQGTVTTPLMVSRVRMVQTRGHSSERSDA